MICLGDTHGLKPIFGIIDHNNIQNSNIVHVGDFGLGFQEIDRDIKNLYLLDEALLETNNKLYVCRGNHDNPIFWRKNAIHLPKFYNIVLCEDYSIHNIENRKVLFVGGGISIDRTYRMEMDPPSYWEDEEIVFDFDHPNLKKNIDVVVTHSGPDFCTPIGVDAPIVNSWAEREYQHGMHLKLDLKDERAKLAKLYEKIREENDPEYYVYGHFHMSSEMTKWKTKFIGLDINEIKEI